MVTKQNKWMLADLKTNPCKQIWESGAEYFKEVRTNVHRHSHPNQLLNYMFYLYLTGARLSDPLRQPQPKIYVELLGNYVKINTKRTLTLPIMCVWEQRMWERITTGGSVSEPEQIFRFAEWNSLDKRNLSKLIKSNFKLDLQKGSEFYLKRGLTSSNLFTIRLYNVLITHHVPSWKAIEWFGWKDSRPMASYPIIEQMRKEMPKADEIEELKRLNLLKEGNEYRVNTFPTI